MNAVSITSLQLSRGTEFSLGPVDFEAPAGSRTAIVGPSGCGKTTILRCIAGLEREMVGEVTIGDRVVDGGGVHVPPNERKIGFVFQAGALWPHLSCVDHLRFVAPALTRDRAAQLLDEVGLAGLEDRRPGELSGGEAQRLALARALAGDPELLLLDEPLSSVDAHIRADLCALLRQVVASRGLTMLVVTHDRDEAMMLADRVVVMRAGRIVEAGALRDVVESPQTLFAARFLGGASCASYRVDGDTIRSPFGALDAAGVGDRACLAVLPRDVVFGTNGVGTNGVGATGAVVRVTPTVLGTTIVEADVEGFTVRAPCAFDVSVGDSVGVELRTHRVFPDDEEQAT